MAGLRLVPAPGATFPYDGALRLLQSIPAMELHPLDIPALVAAGKAMGWSAAIIDHHWTLSAQGKCFRFEQMSGVELCGSLYEDNVFFSFADADHEAACRPIALAFAHKLGLVAREE